MEVAGQWRREWAGTAEYGKVIEGGVTRRVARAMEVLNASAPGARVRVMRAAYHSSAGPGAPTASYMMHSSRQVLSSGYNFLEPSSLPTKPLEISSMPLDSSPERETENYKVTEPDDFDISEPSKWRASSGKTSIRMPSEESSSTDNASIIDLDSRSSSRNNIRRSFNRKHDINSRVSPLLDAPTALSTLKYTSLLNASDDWNNRRKSYSFEDTSPLNKSISPGINLSIESSTDSGICKSSEIFQDNPIILKNKEKDESYSEFTFKDWLSKNRENSYKEIKVTQPKIVHVEPKKTNITLQSTGKVTITLPTDTYSGHSDVQSRSSDDNDRRTKKVEFCKTELHFAADTGTVNIIATDEKPPPSNDFRRRRSAFVPLNEKSDRSITLFGDKPDISEIDTNFGISIYNLVDTDENTAATKSILKNKIPKPKPYLLGENMVFGTSSDDTNDDFSKSATVPSAVSLINRQLHSERRYSNDTISSITSEIDSSPLKIIQTRKTIKDPLIRGSPNQRHNNTSEIETSFKYSSKIQNSKPSSVSPTPSRSKIRELRGSELAYFGIPNDENLTFTHSEDNLQEEILHSVKLVQQISNSVCNSEAESDDGPEYQNMPTNFHYKMQPTPRPRTKYSDQSKKMTEQIILHPITEQDTDIEVPSKINRNTVNNFGDPLSSSRKHNEHTVRQVKVNSQSHIRKTSMDDTSLPRRKENNSLKKVKQTKEKELETSRKTSGKEIKKSESPLYVNLDSKNNSGKTAKNSCRDLPYKQKSEKITTECRRSDKEHVFSLKRTDKNKENRYSENGENYDIKIDHQSPLVKKRAQRRTEKLCTPDNLPVYSARQHHSIDDKVAVRKNDDKYKNINNESLDKISIQNSPKRITAVSPSIDKHRKESVHHSSKKDTLRIPKVATDTNHSRHSDGTLSDKKSTSKSNKNTINSQQSSKSNQSKIIITKLDKPVKPRRSKYVINYDDKNGTVSSVCKIKTGPVTYKRKIISIDNKDHKESNKGLNKIALLNLPDRQWIANKPQYRNKWKSPEQKSCQLL